MLRRGVAVAHLQGPFVTHHSCVRIVQLVVVVLLRKVLDKERFSLCTSRRAGTSSTLALLLSPRPRSAPLLVLARQTLSLTDRRVPTLPPTLRWSTPSPRLPFLPTSDLRDETTNPLSRLDARRRTIPAASSTVLRKPQPLPLSLRLAQPATWPSLAARSAAVPAKARAPSAAVVLPPAGCA